MFGDLLNNMQDRQKDLRKQLAEIHVEAEAGDGAIKVKANANREIVNISIDSSLLNADNAEEVEDLLVVALNRALEMAAEKEAAESQNLIKDMLPPGLGNLSDLMG